MAEHYITKCSCGAVIAQCRCPSDDKTVNVVERGCPGCHASGAKVSKFGDTWRVDDDRGGHIILSRADWEFVNGVIHEHYHGED